MDDGPWLLLFLAILASGAIAATLLAAFGARGRKGEGDEGTSRRESPAQEEEGPGVEEDFARLVETETRIAKLSQLIELTDRDTSKPGDLLARERIFLDYLVDFADKCSALLLRRSYREQVAWLTSLFDEGDWIGKSAAFREKLVHEHGELAAKSYFGEHPFLDEALADILADFDVSTERLVTAETARLLDDESPIVGASSLKMREEEEALAAVLAELDRSFDRFAARMGLR